MDYLRLMQKARQANREMDLIHRQCGTTNPADGNPRMLLREAMSAIRCGIVDDDWDDVVRGQALLEQLEEALSRPA